ncbi:hypothetical protein BaRGS_00001736 [Batillaria attramentaria]|uniref:Sulfatase N-terminal domain-containing protein n=1 Tax=Batillaria attramentaria TaxID=370345 RepID=A0ABD0M4M2_9CAEN
MKMKVCFVLLLCCVGVSGAGNRRPHIIFITTSNMGYNDVEWNNPDLVTPNLMELARHGVILNNSYVAPTGAATRAAFLTGYYGFRTGLQHAEIRSSVPVALPTNFTLLPEILRQNGYTTQAIGKWGLGFCNWQYTPTSRGFVGFYGSYGYAIDHYEHIRREWQTGREGIDFHDGITPVKPAGYSTHLFRDRAIEVIKQHHNRSPLFLYLAFHAPREPLQVPFHYERHFREQSSVKRRLFSGKRYTPLFYQLVKRVDSPMVYAVDEAIGKIMDALDEENMRKDTVFIFTSESAANFTDGGSNWPLRGGKGSVWEGGTRVPALVSAWSPSLISQRGRVTDKLMNAVDWFPTILSMAGITSTSKGAAVTSSVDGLDQRAMLSEDKPTREWMIYNIDEITGRRAIRKGKYKLIQGKPGDRNSWYPISPCDNMQSLKADDYIGRYNEWNYLHLFDLEADPDETQDIAENHPDIVQELKVELQRHEALRMNGHKPELPDFKAEADPAKHDGFWMPGWC